MPRPIATPGCKMMYLIKRRPDTSREELVVHWFANHMPAVIESQAVLAEQDKLHATRYIATLFEADQSGDHAWDGVAQLWWSQVLPKPAQPHGTEPTDTFQQKAEPYVPWPTTEYVIIDGSADLPVTPLTLNAPFPTTRSGFFKVTFLVGAKPNTDFDAFFAHWLDVHVPNVQSVMDAVGGLRYVVSHSVDPGAEPYAGMAELYFSNPTGWKKYRQAIQADGMQEWVNDQGTLVLRSNTQMIGIA